MEHPRKVERTNERILTTLIILVLVSLSLGIYAFLQLGNIQNNETHAKQVTLTGWFADLGFNQVCIQNNYTSSVQNITIEYTIRNQFTYSTNNYFQPTLTDLDTNQSEKVTIDSDIRVILLHLERSNYDFLISAFGNSTQ